jgi:hypothetical protein
MLGAYETGEGGVFPGGVREIFDFGRGSGASMRIPVLVRL